MGLEERRLWNKKYFQEHKEELYRKHKLYMQEHPEQRKKHVERSLLRRRTIPEVAERQRESNRKWYRENPDKKKKVIALWKLNVKTEVLTYYGDSILACKRCGFSDIRALTIDHIKDNGAEERRENKWVKIGGTTFYQWLRRQRYPDGYQTLCFNCQIIKRFLKKE